MSTNPRISTDIPIDPEPPTTSNPHSLSKAVFARRAEYTGSQKIKIKIGSWNVAACPGTEKDLGAWFVDGKGIAKNLAGQYISREIEEDGSQFYVEGVDAQEKRRKKKYSTVPKGDTGTIVGGEDIGLYVLGLQEVADLASAREYIIGRAYTDTAVMVKWRTALMEALPSGYTLIAEQQMTGLLLLIFASPTIAPTISSVSTVSVGTGLMGYMGNKGSVTTRIVLGETTRLVFINSHLASGNDPAHLDRRCWDVGQILQRTKFNPISWSGVLDDTQEGIGDEDFGFFFGDLNFRLAGLPGNDIRRLLMLHTRGEYDIGGKASNEIHNELGEEPIVVHSIESDDDSDGESDPHTIGTIESGSTVSSSLPDPDDFIEDPSQDPTSLQATLDSLLPHDELRHVQKARKAFYDGWREGPITFLPTYKYDVGSMGMFDSSEKKRAPSWCDRILFRTRRDKLEFDEKIQEEKLARIKDEEMKSRGMDHARDEEDVLFDYNPDDDGVDEPTNNSYDEYDGGNDEPQKLSAVMKEGSLDKIQLEVYTSHQRVLSSDHKPLDAVFTLEYDAVIPELKAKIQQEVARELDRAENEHRPGITVVVDYSQELDDTSQDGTLPRRESTGGAEGVDFGSVAYQRRKSCALTIANTSQVPATCGFVERPSVSGDSDRIAPPWLNVYFVGSKLNEDSRAQQDLKECITLEPGDAVNATLEIFIDDISLVKALNNAAIQLNDVLVLRVIDGRDHFVPIHGAWLPSCFGRSIEELIRIPEGGSRSLQPSPITLSHDIHWSAPRELFKLTSTIDTLIDRVIADSSMLSNAQIPQESYGWPFDPTSWLLKDSKVRETLKGYLLDSLETDKNLNEAFPPEIPALEKLEILSEILLLFLHSLSDGIIPSSLSSKLDFEIVSRGNRALPILERPEETKGWVLDVLSAMPNHNIAFVFLMSMLSRAASELAPISKAEDGNEGDSDGKSVMGNVRGSMDSMRRSLSWKGRAGAVSMDGIIGGAGDKGRELSIERRKRVVRAYAQVFERVVFRNEVVGGVVASGKEKEKKGIEERRREILESVLRAS
ncbi:hypothetical protein B7494_g5774 [Chlorociboria aeruginascens]|nr:hypothetical protein B7494_g5774 [Chlorociboria aeruginascens]